jgi:dihydrofolate reductase
VDAIFAKNMRLSFIVAIDEDNAIGYQNQLPWHMPADLQHFKKLTIGKVILMGRKTYVSIGKPLPQRENVIISHDPDFQASGCRVFDSLENALRVYQDQTEVMVIGGAGIFAQLLPQAERIYLTRIRHRFTADIFFPKLDLSQWQESDVECHQADEKNPYDYMFVTLNKKTAIS